MPSITPCNGSSVTNPALALQLYLDRSVCVRSDEFKNGAVAISSVVLCRLPLASIWQVFVVTI